MLFIISLLVIIQMACLLPGTELVACLGKWIKTLIVKRVEEDGLELNGRVQTASGLCQTDFVVDARDSRRARSSSHPPRSNVERLQSMLSDHDVQQVLIGRIGFISPIDFDTIGFTRRPDLRQQGRARVKVAPKGAPLVASLTTHSRAGRSRS